MDAKSPRPKVRLVVRIDADLGDLIVEAAARLRISKARFVSDAIREAALTVIARADAALMAPEVFDAMMTSIDVADESSELETLAAMPRRITKQVR